MMIPVEGKTNPNVVESDFTTKPRMETQNQVESAAFFHSDHPI
ncbi:MAG: hypothetical protein PHE53_08845 [Thermoguttaceae bacterium]|nr:hypothetical protein [Thermoguttaceae bacterium]